MITVVFAADDPYALPLAAAIRSVLDNAADPERAELFVLDFDLSERTKGRLARSWEDAEGRVSIVSVDLETIASLPPKGEWAPAIYLRLLVPDALRRERAMLGASVAGEKSPVLSAFLSAGYAGTSVFEGLFEDTAHR